MKNFITVMSILSLNLVASGIIGVNFEYGIENDRNVVQNKNVQYASMSYELGLFKQTYWSKIERFALSYQNRLGAVSHKHTYHDVSIINSDVEGDLYKGAHKKEEHIFNFRYAPKSMMSRTSYVNLSYQYIDYKNNIYGKNSQGYKSGTTTFDSILEQSKEKDIYTLYRYSHVVGVNYHHFLNKEGQTRIRLGLKSSVLSNSKIQRNKNAVYHNYDISKDFNKRNLIIDADIKRYIVGFTYMYLKAEYDISTKNNAIKFGVILF